MSYLVTPCVGLVIKNVGGECFTVEQDSGIKFGNLRTHDGTFDIVILDCLPVELSGIESTLNLHIKLTAFD